jgi:hypothetical protein
MEKNRKILLGTSAALLIAGGTIASCTNPDDSVAPAPQKESAEKKTAPERADLLNFTLDNRSQPGLTDIWVKYEIKNSSTEKSDYQIDWEVVNATGQRVEDSTEYVNNVLPGQTAKGDYPTSLQTTNGMKVNITSFDRTGSP